MSDGVERFLLYVAALVLPTESLVYTACLERLLRPTMLWCQHSCSTDAAQLRYRRPLAVQLVVVLSCCYVASSDACLRSFPLQPSWFPVPVSHLHIRCKPCTQQCRQVICTIPRRTSVCVVSCNSFYCVLCIAVHVATTRTILAGCGHFSGCMPALTEKLGSVQPLCSIWHGLQ